LKSVLIDTDILIEVSRGRDATVLARWESLRHTDVPLLCSPVTVAELWCGVRPSERDALAGLLSAFVCVPIDGQLGQMAGEYLGRYARSHHVELGDALIAATASVHKLQLWTRNRKHYPMRDVEFY
jgi:predicted nucleic acid-binding protein